MTLTLICPGYSNSDSILFEISRELKLDEVDDAVEKNVTQLPDKYTFSDMVQSFVAEGTDGISRDNICDYVFDLFFYEIAAVKPLFIRIISMSILFAFFGKLLVTKSQYVSEMSFFVEIGRASCRERVSSPV